MTTAKSLFYLHFLFHFCLIYHDSAASERTVQLKESYFLHRANSTENLTFLKDSAPQLPILFFLKPGSCLYVQM